MASRKRRAPGASPRVEQQSGLPPSVYPQESDNMATEQLAPGWNDTTMDGDLGAAFGGHSFYDFTGGLGAAAAGQSSHSRIVSLDGLNDVSSPPVDVNAGQLVRRNPNQQLAARRRTTWDAFNNGEQQGEWQNAENEDQELEQKALLARKDAQSRRKQIPPFVQKLSSFLDDNKNTNLIRWSDDGNSFIVLDEDEFARTLIPELFKHNNYASFVRQLNMYGFHKKVGLSDNSMKASEMKAKAPSEYYNKYFKRGRPELLWLIQKPKNPASGPKRKREDDGKQGDSDEERKYAPEVGGGTGYAEDLDLRGNQEMAMIPRTEYNSLRSEVRALQQQQKVISNVLGSIRRQNDQLYQQATAFQTLHERHENSINAILTFLATFYNRSLEGNTGTNLADLFGPAISQQQQQPRGNVVDVDEYPDKGFNNASQVSIPRQAKRSLALLPAPPVKDGLDRGDRAATLSPSVLSAGSTPTGKPPSRIAPVFKSPQPRTATGPTGVGSQSTNYRASQANPNMARQPAPQPLQPLPENDEIMSAIQNVNANTPQSATQGPQFDFPAALANYQAQGGNVPLTQQQRNDVLSLMANNASAASPNSSLAQNTNNAMVNPQPPAMPDLSQYVETQAQLDLLQKMSEEQNSRVQSLQERLQPLSPSGSIPGVDTSYFPNANLGEPGQYDLDDLDTFVHGDDFFNQDAHNGEANAGNSTDLPDLNLFLPDEDTDMNGSGANFDGTGTNNEDLLGFDGANDDTHKVESLSSSATSPGVTVEDVEDEEAKPTQTPKRRKK